MSQHNEHHHTDPLAALAQRARLDTPPTTNVTTNVLRQIRIQNTLLAEKPLIWLAIGTTATAVAVALVSTPALMTLLDPLNALFQSTPTSLL
jgi:spore coat protein CotF